MLPSRLSDVLVVRIMKDKNKYYWFINVEDMEVVAEKSERLNGFFGNGAASMLIGEKGVFRLSPGRVGRH